MAFRVHAMVLLAFLATSAAASGARLRVGGRPCVVPSVARENLKTAERRLRAADCAAGAIKGPRNGVVIRQSPRPGRRGNVNARVALTLKPVVAPVPPVQPVGIPAAAGTTWKMIFDSEFNGSSLNTNVWRYGWEGFAYPTSPTQLDCTSPGQVSFPGDGTLHLGVVAQSSYCSGYSEPYTGSMLNTDPDTGSPGGGFQYTYGVLEAKVYLPADGSEIANWPGVWADGQDWPQDGEDDLMEGLKGEACASYHNSSGVARFCDKYLTPGWHTFASDWQPGSITYYYDGQSIGTDTSGVTSSPMFLILDNAVHSNEPTVTEPDSMQVQYVRVWQATG